MTARLFTTAARSGLVGGLVTTLAIAGCGSGSNPAAAKVTKARDATAAQRSVAETVDVASGPNRLTGTGGWDLTGGAGRFHVTLPSIAGIPAGATADAIVRPPVLFANLSILKGPKPWIRIDLRALPSLPGIDVSALQGVAYLDPNRSLAFLTGATTATTVGTESAGGVAATHERVTVDLNKAASKTTGDQATAVRTAAATFSQTTFPMDVWIGNDGLIRKLSYAVSTKASAGVSSLQFQFTLEFTAFGNPVDAGEPPAGQTQEFASLLSALGGP
jgi:hypothetical protein